MEPRVFKVSEEEIRMKKKVFLVLQLSFLFFIPVMALAIQRARWTSGGLAENLIAMIATLALVEGMLIWQPRMLIKRIRETRLEITPDAVERKSGNFSERIPHADITRIEIRATDSDVVASIRVFTSRTVMHIDGMADMNAIRDSLGQYGRDKFVMRKVKDPTHINMPALVALTSLATMTLIIGLLGLGVNTSRIINAAFAMLLGLFILAFRPVSRRAGLRFRRSETVGASIMVVCGLIMMVAAFFLR